ncbi:hypothetical protein [Saccharopolyspora hattusasensis]
MSNPFERADPELVRQVQDTAAIKDNVRRQFVEIYGEDALAGFEEDE